MWRQRLKSNKVIGFDITFASQSLSNYVQARSGKGKMCLFLNCAMYLHSCGLGFSSFGLRCVWFGLALRCVLLFCAMLCIVWCCVVWCNLVIGCLVSTCLALCYVKLCWLWCARPQEKEEDDKRRRKDDKKKKWVSNGKMVSGKWFLPVQHLPLLALTGIRWWLLLRLKGIGLGLGFGPVRGSS